jgi:hypothetical protein
MMDGMGGMMTGMWLWTLAGSLAGMLIVKALRR